MTKQNRFDALQCEARVAQARATLTTSVTSATASNVAPQIGWVRCAASLVALSARVVRATRDRP